MTTEELRNQAADFGLEVDELELVAELLGRAPNRLEMAVFGALWSEHCAYKNSRLLLEQLPTEGPQVLQGPGENAGVVDVGDGLAVAFKIESHNHPSALAPYDGAATGVGGILRDIFAMGARPEAVLLSLRFGPLAEGRNGRLLAGALEGARDYAETVGVTLLGGEVTCHPSYEQTPLVNVMALGTMRAADLQSGTAGRPGNLLIHAGARTGRDGLGGAVFASAELGETDDAGGATRVARADPAVGRRLMDATLELVRKGLVAGVQDMGAAGLSSSVAEAAHRASLGVDLDLDAVPVAHAGMDPVEIMLSETQERMLYVVTPDREGQVLELLARFDLEAAVVGRAAEHGQLRLQGGGRTLAEMPVSALNGAPAYRRPAEEDQAVLALRESPITVDPPRDLGGVLERLLSSETIASKAGVWRNRRRSERVSVPAGAADAGVLRLPDSRRGVAASVDCNVRYCYLEPRLGAAHAVAEAARNVACVGARPVAVTNNLNFGNPTRPGAYYQLEQAILGLGEACTALGTPVTGGNVSLFNEYRVGGRTTAIHPAPTVGVLGVVADVRNVATTGLKRDGDALLLVGPRTAELGASEYLAQIHGLELGRPPALDLELERGVQDAVVGLIEQGLCDTAHDCSEGGIAVTLAEMAILGGRGARVELAPDPAMSELRPDALLYGEAPSRIVIAVSPANLGRATEQLEASGVPFVPLGEVGGEELRITVPGATLRWGLPQLTEAFERPFGRALG